MPSILTSEPATAKAITAAATGEGIEIVFSETVPLVAPPAATTSIVTHVFD